MFPFPKGELCFQVPNNNDEQNVINNGAVNATDGFQHNNLHANYLDKCSNSRSPNTRLTYGQDNCTNNVKQGKIIISGNDTANKRVVHRDTERQRRQEMSSLYSSLRSILPIEHIKGKRLMCDHIFEATKYIKDLERNVKELGDKRDHLKKETCCSSSTKLYGDNIVCSSSTSISPSSRDDCSVSIHTFSKAIEIEICKEIVEDHFPLSRVLKVLNEQQELDVVSCVSSKLNKKWIYVIHCQVEDVASIDSCQLQWRLNSEIFTQDQMKHV